MSHVRKKITLKMDGKLQALVYFKQTNNDLYTDLASHIIICIWLTNVQGNWQATNHKQRTDACILTWEAHSYGTNSVTIRFYTNYSQAITISL